MVVSRGSSSADKAAVLTGRAFLFVPGDRPERFAKAAASGADVVVLDLEDSVAPAAKSAALAHVVDWLAAGHAALVRVNAQGTPTHDDEVAALRQTVAGIMLPKSEDAAAVGLVVGEFEHSPVVLLIETALGIENAHDICRVPGVTRAAFGSVDLAAQLGVDSASQDALRWARSRVVNACAAAGLPGPIDGVTTSLSDDVALTDDVSAARTLGYSAKLCIHPRQVPVVRAMLAASPEEIEQAKRVVALAAAGGVAVLDGQMVDAPVVARARRILEASGLAPDAG
jgi:citrate lyase subunit beta/citryl-CoA lyase